MHRASCGRTKQTGECLLNCLEQRDSGPLAASTLPGIASAVSGDGHWVWQVGQHLQQVALSFRRFERRLQHERSLGDKRGLLMKLRHGRVEALALLGHNRNTQYGLVMVLRQHGILLLGHSGYSSTITAILMLGKRVCYELSNVSRSSCPASVRSVRTHHSLKDERHPLMRKIPYQSVAARLRSRLVLVRQGPPEN